MILKAAGKGLKMAYLPKIALAFEHLHHFYRPYLPFLGLGMLNLSRYPLCMKGWVRNTAGVLLMALLLVLLGPVGVGHCSNIRITNPVVGSLGGASTTVTFNVTWDGSWRVSGAPSNFDAAWVFVKFRRNGGAWAHASLNDAGHLLPTGAAASNGLVDTGQPFSIATNPVVGVFIYRSANSARSTFIANNVSLSWNHTQDGVAAGDQVEVRVFGIEMVYIPAGGFFAGDNATATGSFRQGSSDTDPWYIASEGSFTTGAQSGSGSGVQESAAEYYYVSAGNSAESGSGTAFTVAEGYPKGAQAFFMMKGEISQGHWVAFFNTLTEAQRSARDVTAVSGKGSDGLVNRNNVEWLGSGDAALPDRGVSATHYATAMNYLGWGDVAAYLDWAGLRPMSELEFERAARGPYRALAGEYVWGATSITQATTVSSAGRSNEAAELSANCVYGGAVAVDGPLRVGAMAYTKRTRISTGSGYYGNTDLSGNLSEVVVTVGNVAGRSLDGRKHGNGTLTAGGEADYAALTWPGALGEGTGVRGGSWSDSSALARTSDRSSAAAAVTARTSTQGGRGVRVAPAVAAAVFYPLDTVSNVAAAYSLRQLRSAYAGSAVRVRRSSDSAEQDIGFSSDGEFDSAAFTAFIGAGVGYVRTWYDQSGTGKNADQTATASQPSITLGAINNKPALTFDGTNDFFSGGDVLDLGTGDHTGIVVARVVGNSGSFYSKSLANAGLGRYSFQVNQWVFETSGGYYNPSAAFSSSSYNQRSFVLSRSGGAGVLRVNGAHLSTTAIAVEAANLNNGYRFLIGAYNNSNDTGEVGLLNGNMTELVLLSSTVSQSEQNTIGADFAARYALGWSAITAASDPSTPILDTVNNIAAAYSLRKVRSAYNGSAVRVRRSSDNTEQDIGFSGTGEFDSAAFSSFVGAGTGFVRTWYDQSGTGKDTGQPATASQPSITLSAVNSRPALTFDGSNDFLSGGDILDLGTTDHTGIVVARRAAGTTGGFYAKSIATAASGRIAMYINGNILYGLYEPSAGLSNPGVSFSSTAFTQASFVVSRTTGGSAVVRTNGALAASATIAADSSNYNTSYRFLVGAYNDVPDTNQIFYLNGNIAELVILSSTPSTAEHNAIGGNFTNRYGLTWTPIP
jgi:hypothetical protein